LEEHKRSKKVIIIIAVAVALAAVAVVVIAYPKEPPGGWYTPNAVSALRKISVLQELYRTRTGRYGDYFKLYDGKIYVYIERGLIKSDPDHPEHVCFVDHYFDISVNADGTDWCAIAIPAEWGRGGIYNIKIDREGILRYNDVEDDLTNFPKVLGGS
jgi:hypothetical protein